MYELKSDTDSISKEQWVLIRKNFERLCGGRPLIKKVCWNCEANFTVDDAFKQIFCVGCEYNKEGCE